ncbi:hypothetical protein HWV62_35414 [Athelia sp. TMB]|nr:hypothetical protein HWV62_35414 [Athelia sp. TMB]
MLLKDNQTTDLLLAKATAQSLNRTLLSAPSNSSALFKVASIVIDASFATTVTPHTIMLTNLYGSDRRSVMAGELQAQALTSISRSSYAGTFASATTRTEQTALTA